MTSGPVLKSALRLLLCAVLLIGVFHSIFEREALSLSQESPRSDAPAKGWQRIKATWKTGGQQFLRVVQAMDTTILLISLLLMGITIQMGAIRWNLVLQSQGIALPFRRVFEISLVAQFFNSFLLGASGGDVIKALFAARESHHHKPEAVTTVFLDRSVGLLSMLAFSALMVPFNWNLVMGSAPLAAACWLSISALLGGLAFFYITMSRSRLASLVALWAKSNNSGAAAMVSRMLTACRGCYTNPALLLKAVLISVLINTLCVVQFWLIGHAMNLHIPFLVLSLIVPMVVVFSALPVTPSGLGLRENLFVSLLSIPSIGAPMAKALTLSLVAYTTTLVWSLVGGLVYVAFKDSHRLQELAHADKA